MAEGKMTKALNEGMQIPCPKCLESMNMGAQRCPNCKVDFSKDEVRANVASKKAIPKGCLVAFGIIIGTVVAIVLAGVAARPDQKIVTERPTSKNFEVENPKAARTGKMSAGDEYAWKEAAKQVVGELLRDPDAAVYSDMKVYPETEDKATIICGYVNSPNAFGGMTGRQRFIAGGRVLLEEQFTNQQMNVAWAKLCR